jgi:hypothetical protein
MKVDSVENDPELLAEIQNSVKKRYLYTISFKERLQNLQYEILKLEQ